MKKLISMLIIIGFSLTQTACMRCCVTTDLIKRIDDESKQPPKMVRYVDRVDKVISAYINDEEDELTICVEGKLAEKTTTQQFALKTSLNVEQLKNQPPKGITYQAGSIPTIQIERHSVIHYCPAQPTNTRTLMTANFNVDKDNISNEPSNTFMKMTTVQEKLASVHIRNNEQERDFIAKNHDKFQNITQLEYFRLLQPIRKKSDSVFYVSMEKTYPSQYLVYTNYRSLTGVIEETLPLPFETEPAQRIQRERMSSLSWYTPKQEIHIINPAKFDGQHFVVFKIKEEEKIIQNHFSMNYLALPLTIVADVLLSPFYLLHVMLCPPQGCRLII